MRLWANTKWIFLLSLFLILSSFALTRNAEAQAGRVDTQTCTGCHIGWQDNNPRLEDVVTANADIDYFPLNFAFRGSPFYFIPEAYFGSIHSSPDSNPGERDHVTCEGCHGSGLAHFGLGPIPNPIPQTKTCVSCHKPPHFEKDLFLATSHANPNKKPKITFDQGRSGKKQATIKVSGTGTVYLFRSDDSPVTKSERIEECSVCHSYALAYPQFKEKIGNGTFKKVKAEVSCGACHDAHIPAPNGNQPASVGSTATVAGYAPGGWASTLTAPISATVTTITVADATGSPTPPFTVNIGTDSSIVTEPVRVTAKSGNNFTVIRAYQSMGPAFAHSAGESIYLGTINAAPSVAGREVSYLNHKPYKIDETGAQSKGGTWVRGSAIARPNRAYVSGTGILSNNGAIANRLTFPGGGFVDKVKPGDALLISGVASATVNLPDDAVDAGLPITVQATLNMSGGYKVEEVIDDTTLVVEHQTETDSSTNPVIAQLGNNLVAVVSKTTVTYKKASGTGSFSVFVPFTGESVSFEVRDMYTNMENLCGSCHTQGKYRYTGRGKTKGGAPVPVNLSSTHNNNIMAQYRTSGHADKTGQPFGEFTVFGGHQLFYPNDMSITGNGGIGTRRNRGNTDFALTPAATATNEYLSASGNTTLPGLAGSFACLQCHHGLASIDYQLNRIGTPDAQVVWGDSTVTCITCHDPHENGAGSNIRVPASLSFNSAFTGGTTNRMMDGTAIPAPASAGKGIICLFCHQGRESGFTVYKYILTRGVSDPYGNPTQNLSSGSSSRNSHYLAGGALLWSKNSWEFFFNGVAQSYTNGNTSHQGMNCMGCHMGEVKADNTEGGHTWKPRIEYCQPCHSGMTDYKTYANQHNADYDGNGVVEPTAKEIDGLIAQLIAEFDARNIIYDPSTNPYFFAKPPTTSITWNTNTLTASFNLNELFKTSNALYVHNSLYTIQVLRDSLQALKGTVPAGFRPPGERPATDYRTITP